MLLQTYHVHEIARGYPNTLCIFYGSIMGVQSPSILPTLYISTRRIKLHGNKNPLPFFNLICDKSN